MPGTQARSGRDRRARPLVADRYTASARANAEDVERAMARCAEGSARAALLSSRSGPTARQHIPDPPLRPGWDGAEGMGALEAPRVEFVPLPGPRRARGEPAVGGDPLDPADGLAVLGRRQHRRHRLAAELAEAE